MGVYVPGTTETDPKKQNRSLQQLGAATEGVQSDVATAQADIATAQTDITTLQTTTLQKANNLSDVASASTSLTNLAGVSYASQTLTSAQQTQARSNIGGAPAITVVQGLMTSDVAVASLSTYAVGPSVTLGTGTWFVVGKVILQDATSANAGYFTRLWDGTTLIDNDALNLISAGARRTSVLTGIITNPTGNVRIEAVSFNTTTGSMKASADGGTPKASNITAIRIA